MNLRGAPVAVCDVETTGLGPDDKIVSVAVVKIHELGNTEPLLAFASNVNPERPIPIEASNIHGITDEKVRFQPTWETLRPEFEEAIAGCVPCCFNWPFDRRFLGLPVDGLDPLVWAKLTDKYEKSKKLVDVAGRRGITFDAHDAAADAMATARLLPGLLREMVRGRQGARGMLGPWCAPDDVRSVEAFFVWQRTQALAQEQDYAAYCRKNGKQAPTMNWHELLGVKP